MFLQYACQNLGAVQAGPFFALEPTIRVFEIEQRILYREHVLALDLREEAKEPLLLRVVARPVSPLTGHRPLLLSLHST